METRGPSSQPGHRFQAALTSRAWIGDIVLALVLGFIGFISHPTVSFATAEHTIYSLIVIGCCATVLLRSRYPHIAMVATGTLLLLHLFAVDQAGVLAGAVCLVMAYTTQTRLHSPWRWISLLAVYAGALVAILMTSTLSLHGEVSSRLLAVGAVWTALTVAALAGVLRRHARARYVLAVEKANALEAHQAVERQLAASEERNRIAREMHDVLGHSLNTIAVQAEGARYALPTNPEATTRALEDIGRVSRAAVDEVRDLIDVLRTEDETAPTRPAPSLKDLPELVGTFQDTGVTVRLRVVGDLTAVPNHVGLAAYRIIQEALTNALKHATHTPTTIRVSVGVDNLSLLIVNPRPTTRETPASSTKSGHGLIGMRERVRALSGHLEAGPDPSTGGWRVAAKLPWSRP